MKPYVIVLLLVIALVYIKLGNSSTTLVGLLPKISVPTATPEPTPKVYKPIDRYGPPTVNNSDSYTIIFLGDSMTAALGENFDELRKSLNIYYPDKVFGLFNYGFGSSNIFSVEDRLYKQSTYLEKTFPPILKRHFDIIIIESFAYNPLSQYNLEQGLIHQNETLNKIIAQIVEEKPNSLIIFLATIAPSKQNYGLGTVKLSPENRKKDAEERIAYLENHIAYAREHNFPLINVYEKSLDASGNAVLKYINPNDYIHPSSEGVKLISQEIADFLNNNDILPR